MKKKLLAIALALFTAAASFTCISYADETENTLLAFPGAEGGGKYTMGARANDTVEIYHVTNLNDSGEGSLRDAVSEPGRIVVFDLDGAINIKSPLKISGNTTILGQTAPGEGITVTGYDVSTVDGADNIIIRYLKVRPTDVSGDEPDGLGGRWNKYVIFDHCSVSWSVDEAITLYGGDSERANLDGSEDSEYFHYGSNLTVQNCLVSESLRLSSHIKGAHGYGGITGADDSTFYHNVLAHHDSRIPRIDREIDGMDVTNNVIYNWGYTNSVYGAEPYSYNNINALPTNINFTNNYFNYGPSTRQAIRKKIFEASYDSKYWNAETSPRSNVYFSGNAAYGYSESQLTIDGKDYLNLLTEPVDMGDYAVADETAKETYSTILDDVGATLPKRDAIDARVIADVKNMTGRIVNNADEVGGMIDLNKGTTETRVYEIPAEWISENGLSAYGEADIIKEGEFAGYTLMEAYVNDWTEAQSAPTNPSITVTSPAIASVTNKVNGATVNNGNWTVITTDDTLSYKATAAAVGGAAVTSMKLYDGNDLVKDYGAVTSIDDNIVLDAGTHFLSCRAENEKGEATQSTTSIVYVKKTGADLGEYSFTELGSGTFAGYGGAYTDGEGNYTIYGSGYLTSSNTFGSPKNVTSDSCSYMYKAVTGDFEEWVRIDSIPKFENRQNNGLMFRETLDANSRMAMITDSWITNGENETILYRGSTGAQSTALYFLTEGGAEVKNSSTYNYPLANYFKISRSGDEITLSTSVSGNDYTDDVRQPYTLTFTDLPDTVYIGFAVDSSENLSSKPYFAITEFSTNINEADDDVDHSTDNGFSYDRAFLMKNEQGGEWVISSDGKADGENDTAYETKEDISGNATEKLALSDKAVQIAVPEEYQSGNYQIDYDFLTTNTAEAGRSFRMYLDNAGHAYDASTGQATEMGNSSAFFHITDIMNTVYAANNEADIATGSVSDNMTALFDIEANKWYHVTIKGTNGENELTLTVSQHGDDGSYNPDNLSEALYTGVLATVDGRDSTAKQLKFMRTASGTLYFDNIVFAGNLVEDTTEDTSETPSEETTEAHLLGDIDGNDRLTANDAAALLYYVINGDKNPEWHIDDGAADLNGDNAIDASDAALILKRVINPAL